jgi:hypothetical protein
MCDTSVTPEVVTLDLCLCTKLGTFLHDRHHSGLMTPSCRHHFPQMVDSFTQYLSTSAHHRVVLLPRHDKTHHHHHTKRYINNHQHPNPNSEVSLLPQHFPFVADVFKINRSPSEDDHDNASSHKIQNWPIGISTVVASPVAVIFIVTSK